MFTTTKALLCCTLLVFVFVDIEVVTAMPLEMAETQPQQIVVDDMVLDAVPAKSGNTDMYMLMPENSSDDAANDGESELTQNIIESQQQQQQQQVADEVGTAEAASDMLMMESNDEPVQVEIVRAPGQSAMPLAEQIQMAEEVVQALNDDEKPEPVPLVQNEPEKVAETQQQQVASMEMPALEMLPMPEALIATENSSINEEAIDAPTQSLETQSVSDVIANAIDTIEQQIQAEQQLNDETANEDDLPQQQNDKISLQLFDLPTESEESAADDAKAESDLEAAAAAAEAAKPVEAEATAGNSLSELAADAGESFMQALDNMLPEEVAEQQAIEEEKKQEEVEQQQQDDAEASETQNAEQIVEAAKEDEETAAKESEQASETVLEAQAEQQSQPEPTQAQEIEEAPQQMELTEQINKEKPAEMEQEVAAVEKQESPVKAEVAEVAEEKVPVIMIQNEEPQEQQQQIAAAEAEVMPAEQVTAESQVQEQIAQQEADSKPVEQAPMQADEVEAQAPEAQTERVMEIATPIEVQQVLEEIESEQENAQQSDEEPLILMPAEPEQMEQVQQVMQVISEAMAEAQNGETQVDEEQPQEPQQPAESEVAVEQVKVEMPEYVKVAEQQQANEETVAEAVEEPQEATIGVEFGVPEVASAAQSEVSMESLPAVAADEPVEEVKQENMQSEELAAPANEQQVPKEEEPVANEIESNAIAETAAEVAAEQVQQDAEVAEEQQKVEAAAQTLVDAINLVESLETAQAVEENNIEEQPTVEQLAAVEPAAAAQEPQATEQQQSEVATSEAETPVESLMDDTQPALVEATAPQQQPTALTSEQLLTTIVQLPAALQQTEVGTESQVPLAEAQQDDTNTQPQTVRDENLLASEPQQQITEQQQQQQAATAAVAAAAIESSSTANVQQQQPLNVADSVLNYVNASFIQKQQQQTQQQQMQQQIQQQIQQAINNHLSNNNSNKKQQQQQPTENNNNQDDDNKVTSHLRRYDGAQVWRIVVQNDRDKKLADELQSKYDGQLWKEVKQEVDYLLKPQVLAAAERHVRAANLSRIVLIDNLQRVIEVENPTPAEIAQLQNRKGHRLTWQAYHRLEDIHGFFDYLAKTYPDICSVETIGYSIEKRPLKILKVSNGNSSNPGIWMDGGMHAREWISPATVTYIANQIVEGWDDLPAYMRNINWYIHAVANPDGYEYSHTTDRLWRKNMRSHGRQCPGVDLNRNFGYKWGGKGTSANPCSQTYRGSKAFSEPETFYISKFISNFPRGTFQSYLSFHSYGQYVLFPWGYDYLQAADHNDLDRVARQAGSIITKSTGTKYTVGSSANTLYPAAGGSDDWAKGIAGIKYSYTIEMGDSGRYGFVLPASFIQTNGKDGYTFVDTVARSIVMKGNDKLRRRRS